MGVADILSERATCTRRKVGAVLTTHDNIIVSTGYNGAPSGYTHCTDGGCPRGKLAHTEVPAGADYNQYPCVAVHAEANAIIRAGSRAVGGTIYVNSQPCQQCSNLIRGVGIKRVVYRRRSLGTVIDVAAEEL